MKGYKDKIPSTTPINVQPHARVFLKLGEDIYKVYAMADGGAVKTVISEGMVKLLGWSGKMSAADPSQTFMCAGGSGKYKGRLSNVYLKVHDRLCFKFDEVNVLPSQRPYILLGDDICHFFHPTHPFIGTYKKGSRVVMEWHNPVSGTSYQAPVIQLA